MRHSFTIPGSTIQLPVGAATRMTIDEMVRHLQNSAQAAKFRHAEGTPAYEKSVGFIERQIENLNRDEYLKDRHELFSAFRNGAGSKEGVEARNMIANIVVETATSIVLSDSSFGGFANFVSLEHNAQPEIHVDVPHEVTITSLDEKGNPARVQPSRLRDRVPVHLYTLVTDAYEYPLFDLIRGRDTKEAALATIDLARDMAARENEEYKKFVLVGASSSKAKATFVTTGDQSKRSYIAHSTVNTNNFPAGNLLTMTGATTSSVPTIDLMRKFITYQMQWGAAGFSDGPQRLKEIIIPSKFLDSYINQVDLTSRGDNPAVQQIFAGGAIVELAGHTFMLRGDNTLDPTAGAQYAYGCFDKKLFNVYDKPDLLTGTNFTNGVYINEDYMPLAAPPLGVTLMQKVFGAASVNLWDPRMCVVKWRNA